MRELEVAFAIALTFLIFSTILSMVLEVLYRFKKNRLKGLQVMLKDFYESELSPLLHRTITSSDDFAKHILQLNKDNHALSTGQFIERLATSEVASQISNKTIDEIQVLVNDFARRYEEYGNALSHKFKLCAERDNLIIGVAVALLLNVNVVVLTKTFLDNRGLTESLISKSEVILESAEVQQKRMQKLDSAGAAPQNVAEFKVSVERLQKTIEEAKGLDLPLGWSRDVLQYFEKGSAGLLCPAKASRTKPETEEQSNAQAGEKKEPFPYAACQSTFDKVLFWGFSSIAWLLSTIMTGLLIGLGGPFWFDVIKRINLFRNMPTSISPGKKKATEAKVDEPPTEDYVTLFTNAHVAANIIKGTTDSSASPKPHAPSNIRLGKIIR
jgi:hypothetical protein